MFSNINYDSDDFLKVVDLYYDREIFKINCELFRKLSVFYNDLKENQILDKIFTKRNETKDEIFYEVDLLELKTGYSDFFLMIVKFLKNFGEEIFSFLKILLHLENAKEIVDFQNTINFGFTNSENIFVFDSTENLKINHYIEFFGNIKKISLLKTINLNIEISCSKCGLLVKRKVWNIHNTKLLNPMSLSLDKKFHACQESLEQGEMTKIYKEFTDSKNIRYFKVQLENSNEIILCYAKENLFSRIGVLNNLKFSGIVRTKPEGINQFDNFFEKIIEIFAIENVNLEVSKQINDKKLSLLSLPFFIKNKITSECLQKIEKLSSYKCLNTYFLLSLVNQRLYSHFDFSNILIVYYLFSKKINLNIHLIDLSKNDYISSILKNISQQISGSVCYQNFNNDSKLDLVQIKETLKENYEFKFGEILNTQDKFLIYDNLPQSPNQNFINFLTMKLNQESFDVAINSNENNANNFICYDNKCPILTTTKINLYSKQNDLNSSTLMNLVHNFEVVSIYTDKNDIDKDRSKAMQIIENQYNSRKRKFNEAFDFSQLNCKTQLTTQQPQRQTQIGANIINDFFNQEELYIFDTQSYPEYYKSFYKKELDIIKRDCFLCEINNSDSNLLMKYISFVNEFINPALSISNQEVILFLTNHLTNYYKDLLESDLELFDINKIKKLLSK